MNKNTRPYRTDTIRPEVCFGKVQNAGGIYWHTDIWRAHSQFFNAVKPKKGPIHEFSDAVPLHLQWPQWLHPFESQAVHNLDLVTLHFSARTVSVCRQPLRSLLTGELSPALECTTYRNWSCGSLKTLDGSTANLFLLSFSTSSELETFSKQPGSRTLILLLLRFLWHKNAEESRPNQEKKVCPAVTPTVCMCEQQQSQIYTRVFLRLVLETGLVKHNWDKVST